MPTVCVAQSIFVGISQQLVELHVLTTGGDHGAGQA
jgi:hypothetical protein